MANPYTNKVVINGVTKIDLTGDTVSPSNLMAGITAHDASGAAIVGEASGSAGGDYNVISVDNGDGTQDLQITDAEGAISIVPLTASENTTYTAPSGTAYNPVTVAVPIPEPEPPTLETVNITPSESTQQKTPSAGYDGIGEVNVSAIPASYVGSGVARRSSSDLTVSGAIVTAPAGYYAAAASKSIPVYDGSVT